ncbi:hypothetical protein, partial [Actinobacillus pleuropneumoniae]
TIRRKKCRIRWLKKGERNKKIHKKIIKHRHDNNVLSLTSMEEANDLRYTTGILIDILLPISSIETSSNSKLSYIEGN